MTKKTKIIISVSSVILALILLVCAFCAYLLFQKGSAFGVTAAGKSLRGLSKEQAISVLNEEITELEKTSLTYKLSDKELSLPLIDIEYDCDAESIIEKAFAYGKEGSVFTRLFNIFSALIKGVDFPLEPTVNMELLKSSLCDFASENGILTADYTYRVEGPTLFVRPEPGKEKFDLSSAESETIISLTYRINTPITLKTVKIGDSSIDAETLHSQIARPAEDAAIVSENGHRVLKPEKNGIDFSVEEAKTILSSKQEEYKIPIKILYPEITTDNLLGGSFKDTLGTYTSTYDASLTSRTQNLKIAARKINGTILMPGDVFSFNRVVGERTVSAGYKDATIFVGNKMVPGLAGGICQISSTLYNSALLADLEIVERKNHSFYVAYVPKGLDATVAYGSIDFKFKNNTENPIKITAAVSGGAATIKVLGTQTTPGKTVSLSSSILSKRDFTTVEEKDDSLAPGERKVIQEGMPGYTCSATRTVYINGVVSRVDKLSNSVYVPCNRIVAVGPPAEEVSPVVPSVGGETPIPGESPAPPASDIPAMAEPTETPAPIPSPMPEGGEIAEPAPEEATDALAAAEKTAEEI